ncbi:hypothetical protein ILUMI_12930 [Ignelater luminosus]|uniref:RRM domain-containing protein n=1 Tax=Ignelater luminosus TaxID=2038154 RepID=A0A8K0CVG6_IGNLU|nr:hypothetical protein ILUMI_12930 [Ignelater luminosus]
MADRSDRKHSYSDTKPSLDDPPNSRLFIICSKQLAEEDFRNAFSKFGEIEEIWVVKDRNTGERKGVTYIKYSKTSEAAAALEAMNGKVIGNTTRHIKVMIAASRDQGSKRDGNEEEKIQRLFVIVPKSMSDEELYNTFKVYGDIDYATVIKDKETRESKGFAYIKYYKFSHAAAAYEQCDRKFKAVFAEPRKPRQYDQPERFYSNSYDSFLRSGNHSLTLPDGGNEGYTRLQVIGSPQLNQDQLWKLFDIVPGMDYCQLRLEGRPRPVRSIATVVYANAQAASYACEKLHGFEYPPGSRLIVKPEYDAPRGFSEHSTSTSVSRTTPSKPDLLQLAETIAQATSIIQAAGISPDLLQSRIGLGESSRKNDTPCSVKLPDKKPLAGVDAQCEARCFIVCSPQQLPSSTLRDIFCRFGDLIDVYMLYNRNCGYAKYASRQAAENAISTLHGAEVCGIRIKVMEAEERDHDRKRLRLDDESC